jgi:hypothetical protein
MGATDSFREIDFVCLSVMTLQNPLAVELQRIAKLDLVSPVTI